MIPILLIFSELILVSALIILMYRLKSYFGLAPIFILLGSYQYFQTVLSTAFYITFFNNLSISPGSVILFASNLFAILLIYIKEGPKTTQRLILGIVLANISITFLGWMTNLQEKSIPGNIYTPGISQELFHLNYHVFFVGTTVLIIDAFLIIILYAYLFKHFKSIRIFFRLLLTMLIILNIDAVLFVSGNFWNQANYSNILISHMIAKSIAAVVFSLILCVYLCFIDADKNHNIDPGLDQDEDIFSILNYKTRYERLVIDKNISEEMLQKIISIKTSELEKSIVSLKEREEKFRTLIEQASDGIFIANEDFQFTEVNSMACKMLGYPKEEMLLLKMSDLAVLDTSDTPLRFNEIMAGNPILQERKLRKKDGSFLYVEISAAQYQHKNYLSIVRDISERKNTEKKLNAEKLVLKMIATGQDFQKTLKQIVLNFESSNEHTFCSILLADEEGKKLTIGAAPSLPPAFNAAVDGFPIGDNQGSCGTAAYLKQPVIVEDIANDPLWFEYAAFTLSHGLMACWSFPILGKNDIILGTFAIYYKEKRKPSIKEISMIERAANLVKINLERHIFEIHLKESESKYRTLVEEASDGIFIIDEKGSFLTLNSSASKITGYPKDEIMKKSIYDFVLAEDLDKEPFHFSELMQGHTVRTERQLIHKSGNHIPIEITSKLITGNKLLVFIRDITDRKNALRERELLQQRNEQTIATMQDGFILADNFGNIIDVNASYCRMTGYTKQELLNKNIQDIEANLPKVDVEIRIKEIIEKKSMQFETAHRRKDDTSIDLDVSISIMLLDGQPVVAAFVKDITERKKTQEQLNTYNKQLRMLTTHLLNIREEERRRIGREIHDDLGQQLTAIKMDVAWIDKKTPESAGLVKNKLKNIIGLLDGSNLSIRRILNELKPSILDEYGLLDALQFHASQFSENTSIPIQIICSENEIRLPEEIATCIFRIFQESLTNISRYAQATKVKTKIELENNHITVCIEDNGVGFDQEMLIDKKSFGIIGMKERVRALEGNLNIISEPGTGTKIHILIPFKNE